ncbi:MAG: amidohydrolase family protein [Proteobacteria bacterium]|nr:amidohydrolase family protein [Pseudomonadota bacterium]
MQLSLYRHLFPLLGLVAAGCASTPAYHGAGPAALRERPLLDVYAPWDDPEQDYAKIRGDRTARRDSRDPRVNPAAPIVAVVGATILTATGKRFDNGTILLRKGSIEYVGDGRTEIPDGARVIDAAGKFVTPGLIDTHSHLGVYPAPSVSAHSDGNEYTAPVTAQARAESAYWPQDPGITRVLAGGVTTALILPGSTNLVGGAGFTVIMRTGRTADDVRFPGAPATIKMACGENPKRYYAEKGGPSTRMGLYAAFRAAFRGAAEYGAKVAAYRRKRDVWLKKRARAAELDTRAKSKGQPGRVNVEPAPEPPPRNYGLETLAAVLRGEVLVQIHCYRATDMREMVAIAEEFGFAIRSFHHALEAYKIRDLLIDRGIAINTWTDWWGFKMEAFDGIAENAPLVAAAGGRAVIHSDSAILAQRLNQEAAKAMYAARHAGIEISEDQALRWITANAAWVLGVDEVTGTLEKGKRADVVIWSRHPFSVYAKADVVIQAGEIIFERKRGRPLTDFELGNSAGQHKGAAK